MNITQKYGLSSLLGPDPEESQQLQYIPAQDISPNPFQPRRALDENSIAELAASIKANGLLQPILVRHDPEKNGKYQIIAGERRWKAAIKAQLRDLPVLVCALGDKKSLEYALLENVQRENLNCIDEAEGYARLIAEFDHTQEHLAHIIGKSRSHIANLLRLLNLPISVKEHVRSGRLSFGHARTLVGQADAEARAEQIVNKKLTVRQAEKQRSTKETEPVNREALSEAAILAEQLTHALGVRVHVDLRHEGGVIHLHFRDLQELERLIERLN
ncbi:MAG: ParB/RepB/Spo0J family partition protein [Holosporales bacterium]|jgi:ParB family chromosome partitioning protein|nr:ParB/RepB/Spo0J family partition protein [Holosporales bacterium]